ncbi:hypothetical protein IFM89_023967 [Coptis chinensis]|uniref:5'-3' DNA helicase ZGRF1-like N-terminal domain-containing protein n=1 Tax=Coptis chinensis TaxID=261450 RepID=A0A835HRN7_9MAGN|nr:hypothetical protein IFM89_023967 [Coptis chinensis]
MEELKKWTVTYTKHLKQKRKLYHDGVLQLHCSNGTHKFYLYDENGMVIDSRFLKKGEAVECGKTLNFSGYLVDIPDIEDKSKSLLSDLKNVQEMVKKPRQKFGTLHGTELKPSPLKHFEVKVKEEEKEKTAEWHVLYTMQKTKKAKKYHDGILRLVVGLSHTKQVFLYDDSDKLLESRFLKKDEVVRCGETLTFEGYLVDIGNLVENCQPIPDSNVQGRAKRSIENFGRLNVPFAGEIQSDNTSSRGVASDSSISHIDRIKLNGFSSSVGRVNGLGNNVAPGNRPSVVHNIKSESVNGLVNSVAPGNQPSVAHNVKIESEHNGLGNNAAPENHPSLTNNVRTGMTSCSCLLGLYFDISQMNAEWHALYTTQKTQKTKKYHDGFLRLSVGVSQRKQVTLLSKDGTVLSSKYLSFSEDVRTGSKLELTGHLVEIREAILLEGGDIQNANSLGTSLASCPTISTVDRMKLNSSDRRNKTKSYGPPNNTSSGKDLGLYSKSSNVDKDKFSQSGTRTDPIRDAHQILFTLKRPMKEGMPPAKEAIVQQIGSSQDSDLGEFGNQDLLGQDAFELNLMRRSVIHIPDGNPENYNVGSNAQVVTEVSQSECFEKLPASGPHNGGVDLPLPSLVGSDSCPEDPERKNCKELKSKGKEQVDKNEFPSFDLGF